MIENTKTVKDPMTRKEFLRSAGRLCLGTCACSLAAGSASAALAGATTSPRPASASSTSPPFFSSLSKDRCSAGGRSSAVQELGAAAPGDKTPARAVKLMEFAENWIRRFMEVLDEVLDEETRAKVMMTNGRVCFREWIESRGGKIEPVPFEDWAARVKERIRDGSIRIEGNVVYFQYTGSAETGQAAPEGLCLCPLVESKPAGLSATYCLCSLGYVREMYEQTLGRPVEIDLLDSVLAGGRRCRFKITVT